ncbi:Retrovirus-related Pol polyprotein from transposon TNT 1-94 [Gossypium australe]|uniref:Retrovirus-related Pol polyprotein from transposon TNT 1-94 n=1 Tax=Gossypium australe TaxID=47621 RepID=A0A5B6UXS1_9ROSI|nr:Retrovirus-related Pol polyprotein from transposon TNT 1-94 [Gossypium australe]
MVRKDVKPSHRKLIRATWVYRTKFNLDIFVNKYKATLVIKGYTQMLSIEFLDTFALVARLDTI